MKVRREDWGLGLIDIVVVRRSEIDRSSQMGKKKDYKSHRDLRREV